MNKIINHLEGDKFCRGFSIMSFDGIIQESSGSFDKSLAYSIYKIFNSLKDRKSSPRILFQVESGHIIAYHTKGNIVIVQRSLNELEDNKESV